MMERSKSLDGDDDDSLLTVPLQFQAYDTDMKNIQPIPSTSPIYRTKSSVQPLMSRTRIPQIMQRAKSADQLNRIPSMEFSPSPHSSHNTSLEDFKAKAKRKGIVPLPNQNLSLEEELREKQHTILKLQKENEELKVKFTSSSCDGSYKDDFLSQIETISKLKLDCVLKQNEVDRLKAVEVTLKQTKQVLKDTTWALTVKEEDLKNIKTDMRDNYEGRLNELILRLNDRELKLASMKNERDSLSEEKRDIQLRVDELTHQVNCYEQELDAKNKQLESSEAEVKTLIEEKDKLNKNSVDSSAKMESLVEKLRDLEKKIDNNESSELLQDKDETDMNAHQAVDIQNKLIGPHPDADAMSLEQVTLIIQDNANLRLLVEESKESLQSYMDKSLTEKTELREEVAEKGDQINELVQIVNTLRSQVPHNDSVYSTDKDDEPDEDEIRSCPSDDEGTSSMKQQMTHTVSNYEKRINELQSLYDQDVFTLENENAKLQKEVKELQSNYLNVSHSNNTFVLDYEELKASYNEKIDSLKSHYEDLLHKECSSAQQQQTELVAENSKLQLIVEEAEKKFMQHLQHMKDNFNNNYQTDLTSELRKVFAEQTSTVSAIKEDLRKELNDIKSTHTEDLCTVEQEFGVHEMNRCGLDDTYSNEILKLTEERNDAQNAAHFLKDELESMQQEYNSLKELYDALSFDVGEYKNEKMQLLSQINILSEQSNSLKTSLRNRRIEVDEYKVKINDASRTIEDYTKKLIDRSESSSNANDSLRSELGELGDFTFGRSSPNKSNLTRKRSSTLIEQVKVLRSNLDEAKSELKNLHEEHGLSTLVFDRLNSILNLLKKYIESEILEQDPELPGKDDEDKSDKSINNQDSLKLLSENELDLNKIDDKYVKPIETSSFEISENLSIDDSDLSDATANGDNMHLTQQEFERELYDLKIDIPFDYCDPSFSQNLIKERNDELNPSEKFQAEISSLRKQNALLQQKILWLQNQMDIPVLRDNYISGDISEPPSALNDSNEKTPTGSICGDVFGDLHVDKGSEGDRFKKYEKSELNDLQNKLQRMQKENDTLKLQLQKKNDNNQGENINEECMSEESDSSVKTKESFEEIQKLQIDNTALKEKISELEKDIFGSNIYSNSTCNNNSQPVNERAASVESGSQKPLSNMVLFNTQDEDMSLKCKFLGQECEINIPGFGSVKLNDNMFDEDNLVEQTIFDEEFDWDISTNSIGEEDSIGGSKKQTPKQMDSEGHTLKQRDSLSKSFSDLEVENENLRRENVSLKEESERDCRTIIGPGFTSEILYYEHAQPLDGDSVGIKVDAIKTLLNNVVVSQGNEAVSFQEYEGREVILRLLLDIQVEVVDLLKENQVLKVETELKKPCAISSSVQTGDSLIEKVENDDGVESIADGEEMIVNNLLVLGGSESSLSEQDLLCSTILEEQAIGEITDNQTSHIKEIDEDDIVSQEIEDVMVEQPGLCDEELLPKLTSTVKDNGRIGDTGLHIEIVSLEGDDAHITVKVKEKRKKLVVRRFSNILASPGQNVEYPEIVYLSESDALIKDKNDDEPVLVPGFSSEFVFDDGVYTNTDALSSKMSKVGTMLDNVSIFGQNADGRYQKREQTDLPKKIFSDFEADVSKLQKENDVLKMEVDKERRARMHESLQRTRSSSVDSLNRSTEVIPGFSSDCLLQEQSINSAVDAGDLNDVLTMLIENLIVFEGNEEIGFKTSDGNDLSKSFITDCRCQLVNLKKENADLRLLVHDQGDIANVTDTSLQQCLISENLSPGIGENEITTVTHYIDDSLSDVGQTFVYNDVRKVNGDSNEKVQMQQSFIIPGFSKELFHKDSSLLEISTDNTGISDLPLLLESVAIFEGNEFIGFTKSEENDITIRLLNDFKTKIVDLINENNILKETLEEVETIHRQRASSEEIIQESIYAGVEIDDDILNKDFEMDLFVPGFSSELLLCEDVLPFCEVDGLTRKLDALKHFLKNVVIFKGNERIGYIKCNDADISLQLLNDFELEVAQMMQENILFKKQLQIPSVTDNSTEKSNIIEQVTLVPCFSSEIDENSIPQFSTTEFANLHKEDALLRNERQESMDNSVITQAYKRSQYLSATKNQLIDLLLKKECALDKLAGTQVDDVVEYDDDGTTGVQYDESIQKAKEWMECINLESLTQLRSDLDEDYVERIKIIEVKLQEVYRLRMKKARHACDEKIAKMKRDYEEEIARLQSKDFLEESEVSLESYLESLDESIATLIDDTKDDINDNTITDDTKEDIKDVDAGAEVTADTSDSCLSTDGLRRSISKQGKDLSDKCVNTTSSFETDSETLDMEQKEIDKLKESIIELFTKPEVGSEDANVLFRLDDVEGILQENYVQITDMTDKLKGKLCALEKDMIVNFNNTIQEKEREFEEKRNELIFNTKNDLLQDISCVFTKLVNKRVNFVDNKMGEILAQHEEDIKLISQAVESKVQKDNSLTSSQEKGDLPEKLVQKLEDFFQREDILGILNDYCEGTSPSQTDGNKEIREYDEDDDDDDDANISYDYDEDGILFKINETDQKGSPIWRRFFKDENCLPHEFQDKLTNKKIEFKSSIEKNLDKWASHINRVVTDMYGQFVQFHDMKMKHKSLKTSEVISDKMITSLASAHTEMILKTSLQKVKSKDAEIDMIRKVGEFLLNQLDPSDISQHKSQYDSILEKYDSFAEEDEIEKSTKDQFEKEIDDVTKSCVHSAVQMLLEKEEDPMLSFDQFDEAKKVRFMNKGEGGDIKSTTSGDEITRLNNLHTKEIDELREQLHSTVAKLVKQATDDKLNEFEGAKMDLVKQHHFILDEFITEQEKEIEEIRKDHELQLQEIKSDYVKQIYELQKSCEKDDESTQPSSGDDGVMEISEEDMKVQFQKQLEELKKQHSDELSKQRDTICSQFEEEHIENLGNLKMQIEEDHTDHLRVLSDCQQNQLMEIQDLKNQHDDFVQKLQLEHAEEIEKLKKDISNLEDNISKISAGILEELEVLEELRIPVEDDEEDSTSVDAGVSQDGISSSIMNCYEETQKNVKNQYNSQLDVLLSLFDSVLENVSSKISLPGDSFSSEILLSDKRSSKRSLESFAKAEDGTMRSNIQDQIENTFKMLQNDYETWYANLSSEMESQREETNQLKLICENVTNDRDLQRGEINRLKLCCENVANDKETMKEHALEIEALKCSINNQQASIEALKEQLIKKQMMLDAKECHLIEMEEQAKKENQKYMLKLGESSDDQLTIHNSLEEKLKEVKDLNEFLEGKLALISELEEQLNKQQSLVDSKKNQLVELNEEMCKQKEKYELGYKKLLSDKGNEISAMYNELEETLKEKDVLDNLVKTQEASMLKLHEELNKFNDLSNAKEAKVTENEQQLRKEIDRLENMLSNNESELTNIQNALDESCSEKSMLQDEVSKHQGDLQKLEDKHQNTCEQFQEQIKECSSLIEQRQTQLEKIEQQLETERENFVSELSEMVYNKDKEITTIQSSLDESMLEKCVLEEDVTKHEDGLQDIIDEKEKLVEGLHEQLTKQKQKHALDLKELSDNKGKEISAIFNELEEKLKEKDALEDLVKNQKLSISKLEDDLSKHESLNNTKEEKKNEMEDLLKKDIEKYQLELENTKSSSQETLAEKEALEKLVTKQQNDLTKGKEHLKECQKLIEEKKVQCIQLRDDMMVEKGRYVLEVDKLTSTKNQELSNLQIALEEISNQKDKVEDLVNLKQTYISELETQLKDCNVLIQEQVDLLADVEQQLAKERDEYALNLKTVSDVKSEECDESLKEKNELEDVIKKQLSDIGELGKEKKECKAKIDEKQTQLSELELALIEEQKKYSLDLEQLTKEKSEEIVALQGNLEKMANERDELMERNKDNDAMLDKLQEEFNEMEKLILQEKEGHHLALENLLREKNEQITALQNEFKNELREKKKMEDLNEEHVAAIGNMEGNIKEMKKNFNNLSQGKNDEIIALQVEIEKVLKEKDELWKKMREKSSEITSLQNKLNKKSKEIEELKDENNKHVATIARLREQLCEMEKQLAQQKEKHQTLAESSKEKSVLADQICKLEEQLNASKGLLDDKQDELSDAQEKLIEELEKSAMGLQDLSMDKGEEISSLQCEVDILNHKVQDMGSQHATEKENQQSELQSLISDHKEKVQLLQQSIDDIYTEKGQMENVLNKQQTYIGELEEQLKKSKQFIDEKHVQLDSIEDQLMKEKERHATDLEKISNEIEGSHKDLELEKERYISELANVLNTQEDISKGHEQDVEQKMKEIEELQLLIENQKTFSHELETIVETKTQQLDESKQNNAEHILELKKEVNELNARINKQDKNLKEKGQQEAGRKELAEKQKYFVSELETKLQAHKLLLEDKKGELSDLKRKLSEERNQHMLDYEQSAAKQKETISNMEKVLEGEIKEKKELKNYVKSMEDLTEQLKTQLNEHKLQIISKENLLAEMKSLHEKSLEKRNADVEQIALERSDVISDLERQLNKYKVKVTEKEGQLNEMKKEYAKDVETQGAVNDKHLDELNESRATIAHKEKHLIEVNAQHAQALEKLQCDFDDATKQREKQISVLEKSIAVQMKEADELKDIVKRQQALVCELDQQLNQQKNLNSLQEKETGEMKAAISQKANSEISELKNELTEVKEKSIVTEKTLHKAEEAVTKHQIQITELEEQLNEQSVLLHAKDHEFIETKETILKGHGQHIKKLESEKIALIGNVNELEEKLINLEFEMKKKSEELGELQKSQQEMQLEHISEIMKLNNEHRQQIGTLMEIPQKDRNIKSLLLDLQKEADEVLDLVINVPDVNINSSAEQIETLKATWLQEKEMLLSIIDDMRKNVKEGTTYTQMSAVSSANMSTEGMEDFPYDQNGEMSITSMASMASDIQGNMSSENYRHMRNRPQDESEATTDTRTPVNGQQHIKDAFVHDNHVVSEFEKLLNDESNKVEALTAKLEEEVRHRERVHMSHEGELAKVVDRELNLKEKYLKIAELLQKEKNEKNRVMEMLNDAQRLNEIQSQNLEEVQNDKNSLLESYTIVSELENLLTKEKEKVHLINAKLEKERYEKASTQGSLADEKAELKATKEREICLKEKCRELSKLFENETELRKNIADALESEKKMIIMEKKNLEQKEFSLNQKVAELGNDNLTEKFKSLKAWESELKKREKSVVGKEEKVKGLITRIEQGYDILPQKQAKDNIAENNESGSEENDWLRQIQGDQLLDTKHLPLVADLNQKIKNLQKEKIKLLDSLSDLKEEIIEYKKQLKEYQHQKDHKNNLGDKETNGPADGSKENVTSDGQKLLNAGWTIAKVQRLYLKYFRAESFRKALVYQKRYLSLLNENDSQMGSVNNWLSSGKRKYTFKVVVLAVISIRRMKYLVKKYHRNLHKSSPQYQYKDKTRNNVKKKCVENVIDDEEPSPISSNESRNIAPKPHHSASISSKGNSPKPPSNSPSKGYLRQSHSKYVPPSLPVDEPTNIRVSLNNHLMEPANDWSGPSDVPNNRLRVNEVSNGTHFGGSYINNIDEYQNVPASMDNTWANGVPRSYPRPSGIHPDEFLSKISRTNGDSTLSNSRLDKSPYSASHPFVSHPSPLLSSTSRDIQESKDEANESLSTYIQTLETLQNRLKKVGYNDRSRPSLL